MGLPKLGEKAAYLVLDNAKRRNALSLTVLRSLRDQLHKFNTGPDGVLRILPPFDPSLIGELESASVNGMKSKYSWLLDTEEWKEVRKDLPSVIVLRTEGPVFCSGHDLGELRKLSYEEVKETFALCAEVMTLIRRSPAPVVGVIQGLATAAGCQLAFTTDFPITTPTTQFQLPGQSLGLPCTSPSTAVSRRLGAPFTYRMLAMAQPIEAKDLPPGGLDIVQDPAALEARVTSVVNRLTEETAGQIQAFGKWTFWTQTSFQSPADGYADAVTWTGRIMALHSRSAHAKEGMRSFFEKRKPQWHL